MLHYTATTLPVFSIMKKILAVLVLLVLAGGGMIAYNQYQLRILEDDVKERAAAVVEGYGAIIDDTIVPLQKANALTQTQNASTRILTATRTELQAEEDITTIVSLINTVQLSLVSFLKGVTQDQPFAGSEGIALLQREMSEKGNMNTLLTAYNEAAKKWNDRVQNGIGNLKGDILGTEGRLLPYLRFDGQQEYFTTISL